MTGRDDKAPESGNAPSGNAPEYASPPCAMHEVDPAYMGLDADPGAREAASALDEADLIRLAGAVIRDIPDAIVYSDRNGLIRFWNAGAERIFGFPAQEALDQSLDIIIPERLRKRHWDGYRRMMETGRSRHAADEMLSVPALTKSGETLSIQFTVAPVRGADGEISGIVAILRDNTATFTELKRLRARA